MRTLTPLNTAILTLLLAVAAGTAVAAEDSIDLGQVTLEDFAWLAGTWRGTAFGAECEEAWQKPMGGSMIGTFKLVREGEPVFYELMLITHEEGRWVLKVKHFHPDFTAWEEKSDAVVFELERFGTGRLVFNGLTMDRRADDGLDITLRIRRGDEVTDELIQLERQSP